MFRVAFDGLRVGSWTSSNWGFSTLDACKCFGSRIASINFGFVSIVGGSIGLSSGLIGLSVGGSVGFSIGFVGLSVGLSIGFVGLSVGGSI
ncbi:hypothetical protein PmNV_074 [Penaeus monodon nudivirus]|uniref:Uncharacterized protein n=1 Tax=Penaeus monodon nudivirus TaxID=1529056 RepID=A0A076FCB3_9VIRU|nr:hypothetical protein PmNV_074 [Penaeus monodon nudivirus]AII15862.1 hypothetical protein PmNV_074 [Penaeus monodon nudivirus]